MVRASGWHHGMNAMFFITIVREFTAVSLAEAKSFLDRLQAGDQLDLHPYQSGQSALFAEKLLRFGAVERAEVADAEPQYRLNKHNDRF
jgi:hypothetical protein